MIRSVRFLASARLALLALLLAPALAAAEPRVLEDSTRVDAWTLPNGLKVVTRHVPRARAVAIVTCYRNGTADDPAGREGMASLLAELAFRGGTVDIPERSRDEMGTLRPLGWNLKITPTMTHLCEIASTTQFPGVLHQVAARTRGVVVNEALLKSAQATVSADLASTYQESVERALYHEVRAVASGRSAATVARLASGKGLQAITPQSAREELATRFVPANAVLSIAGNLDGFDLHRLVQNEFGSIPGGSAASRSAPALAAGPYRLTHPKLTGQVGAIGIVAPALTDTIHPSFSLHALLLGSFCRMRWGPGLAPIESRFDYSIVDEPEMARVYPPVPVDPADTSDVSDEFVLTLGDLPVSLARDEYQSALENVMWLLGGPMPITVTLRMRREPGALYTLASGAAARAQWGDEAFWSEYRRRFDEAAGRDFSYWRAWFGDRSHLARLRLVPEKATAAR